MQDGERFLFLVVHRDSRGFLTKAFSAEVSCIYSRSSIFHLSRGNMRPL